MHLIVENSNKTATESYYFSFVNRLTRISTVTENVGLITRRKTRQHETLTIVPIVLTVLDLSLMMLIITAEFS